MESTQIVIDDTPKNNDVRIARLLQAAAVLTTSGHCREDAVRTALELERQIIELVKNSETTQGEK
jgi:hypothetical protein